MPDPSDKYSFDSDLALDEDIREPGQYKVILHNDDYTSMEFVVEVLRVVFKKTEDESHAIMLHIHEKGIGVCGIYTVEIAETKVNIVRSMARNRSFPLRCTMEEV